MQIRAILFDLDGTLLPQDQNAFIGAYFKGLIKALLPLGADARALEAAVWQGTGAMMKNDGSKTNRACFAEVFMARTGIDYYAREEEFYRFYRDKMICLDVKPNVTHLKLAELETAGKLKAVITQNIDGLHQMAGSKRVLELHGSTHRNYCRKCGKGFDAVYIQNATGIPTCDDCGGQIKPDVVLYEEGLDQQTLDDAVFYISHADMLIIGGTSLAVYPAAGLINYYRGNKLVLINKSTTPMDGKADLLLQCGLGDVFSHIEV